MIVIVVLVGLWQSIGNGLLNANARMHGYYTYFCGLGWLFGSLTRTREFEVERICSRETESSNLWLWCNPELEDSDAKVSNEREAWAASPMPHRHT